MSLIKIMGIIAAMALSFNAGANWAISDMENFIAETNAAYRADVVRVVKHKSRAPGIVDKYR